MEDRILILAPRGRDAQVVEQVLTQHGLDSVVCADPVSLVAQLAAGAGTAIATEEAVDAGALALLSSWLASQPVWSDFPFIVLTGKRLVMKADMHAGIIEALGNVVLVERPVRGETLASAARSALRARHRQYQARGLLSEREQATADLLSADRRKDQFLAMLAHELRNPLAPIRSAAEVLKHEESNAPPRVRWARRLIERQSQHLSSLLEDLLDVSRINTGKVTLQPADMELNQLVARAVESVAAMMEARRQTVVVSLSDQPIFVRGDAVRLTQVFGNLLDNAAKYTQSGGRIEVTSAVTADGATVTIADNGVGIATDDLPHIFELFSQSNRALDRAEGGLGIGLSLVRSILTMHGGEITAHSAGPGQGTSVTVCLPVRHGCRAAPEISVVWPEAEQAAALGVLVVDDNLDAAEALVILLEMQGHRVRTAADGISALAVCQDMRPDVVLLDIGLPGMDGYEVAARLRAQAQTRDTTLIALTGYGQPDDVKRAVAAGFDHHMVKPVEPTSLSALLRTAAPRGQRAAPEQDDAAVFQRSRKKPGSLADQT